MAYELNDNSGSLFKNNKKEKETHPDRTGKVKVAGVEYWLSGWVRKTNSGDQYLSLAFKPVQQQASSIKHEPTELDDEIPF